MKPTWMGFHGQDVGRLIETHPMRGFLLLKFEKAYIMK